MDQGLCEPHSLAITFGEMAYEAGRHFSQRAFLEDPFQRSSYLLFGNTFDTCHKFEIRTYRHMGVNRRIFGEVAYPFTHLAGLGLNIKVLHLNGPLVSWHKTSDDSHRSGLACSVGPKKPQNFPSLNGKGDILNGAQVTVVLCQTRYLYHKIFSLSALLLFVKKKRPRLRFNPGKVIKIMGFFSFSASHWLDNIGESNILVELLHRWDWGHEDTRP